MSDPRLERFTRNESDVAFKRRVELVWEYLDIQDGDRVLDCGCGMGFYLRVLSELTHAALHGIDRDEKALSFACRELSDREVLLVRGDIHRLPYATESFDKIILSEVLEHLGDDHQGLGEVWRVLRPGGTVAVTVPHRRYPFCYDPLNSVLEKLSISPIRQGTFAGIWTHHQRLYLPGELQALLEEVGFEVVDLRQFTHHCFPFTHLIVYGLGKPALERDLLPGVLSRAAHRFRSDENPGSMWNPVNLAIYLFNLIDRMNDNEAGKRTYINVGAKAVKPGRS